MRVNASRKRPPRFARAVAELGRPGLAKQPSPSLLLWAFELAHDALQRIAQTLRLASLGPLLGSAVRASPSNPALRILLRAFGLARDALQRIAQTLRLAPLGPLLGSAVRASPSNPALRILLRAFGLARDAR